MYFHMSDEGELHIGRDDDERIENVEQIIEQASWSADIDFVELLNEGAPVNLGNSYAEYQFTALSGPGRVERTYGAGPNELKEIQEKGELTIRPYVEDEHEVELGGKKPALYPHPEDFKRIEDGKNEEVYVWESPGELDRITISQKGSGIWEAKASLFGDLSPYPDGIEYRDTTLHDSFGQVYGSLYNGLYNTWVQTVSESTENKSVTPPVINNPKDSGVPYPTLGDLLEREGRIEVPAQKPALYPHPNEFKRQEPLFQEGFEEAFTWRSPDGKSFIRAENHGDGRWSFESNLEGELGYDAVGASRALNYGTSFEQAYENNFAQVGGFRQFSNKTEPLAISNPLNPEKPFESVDELKMVIGEIKPAEATHKKDSNRAKVEVGAPAPAQERKRV